MLGNATNGARKELNKKLRNERDTFGLMSIALSLKLGKDESSSFVHPHRNETKILFNLIRKEKGLQ